MAKIKKKAAGLKTWTGGFHVSASLEFPGRSGRGRDGDYTMKKMFLDEKGVLRASGGCASNVLVAGNKREMIAIAEFIAKVTGHGLVPIKIKPVDRV